MTDLDTIPPEMTSDHVEKIRDGYRVFNGDYKIFFPNNGGREPVQMYLLAALSNLPGFGFDFFSLKALAVAESLLTLPVLFWMGLELAGGQRKRFNSLLALLLTALVAVSYWHVIISRQALRIPLTPLVTALLLIFLARAMRRNSRSDFVKAGLTLGFGLYMYQAVRMLPVVVVAGVVVALIVRDIGWPRTPSLRIEFGRAGVRLAHGVPADAALFHRRPQPLLDAHDYPHLGRRHGICNRCSSRSGVAQQCICFHGKRPQRLAHVQLAGRHRLV